MNIELLKDEECQNYEILTPEQVDGLIQEVQSIDSEPIKKDLKEFDKLLEQLTLLQADLAQAGVSVDLTVNSQIEAPDFEGDFQILNNTKGQEKKTERLLEKYNRIKAEFEQHRQSLEQRVQNNHEKLESLHQQVSNETEPYRYEGYFWTLPNTLAEYQDEFDSLEQDIQALLKNQNTLDMVAANQSYIRLAVTHNRLLRDYLTGQLQPEANNSPQALIESSSKQLDILQAKIVKEQAALKNRFDRDLSQAVEETHAFADELEKAILLSLILNGLIDVDLENLPELDDFEIQQLISVECQIDLNACLDRNLDKFLAYIKRNGNEAIENLPPALIESLIDMSFANDPALLQALKDNQGYHQMVDAMRRGTDIAKFLELYPENIDSLPLMILGVKPAKGVYRLGTHGTTAAVKSLKTWLSQNPGHRMANYVKAKINSLEQHYKKFTKNQDKFIKACQGNKPSACSWQYALSAKYAGKEVKLADICAEYPKQCLGDFRKYKDFRVRYDNNGVPDFSTLKNAQGQPANAVKHKAWIDVSTAETAKAARSADHRKYSDIWIKNTAVNPQKKTLDASKTVGHHTGNLRIVDGKHQIEIQFVDQNLHKAFVHRGGFDYYRTLLNLNL